MVINCRRTNEKSAKWSYLLMGLLFQLSEWIFESLGKYSWKYYVGKQFRNSFENFQKHSSESLNIKLSESLQIKAIIKNSSQSAEIPKIPKIRKILCQQNLQISATRYLWNFCWTNHFQFNPTEFKNLTKRRFFEFDSKDIIFRWTLQRKV